MDENGNPMNKCAGDLGYTLSFLSTLFQESRSGTLQDGEDNCGVHRIVDTNTAYSGGHN